VTDVAGQVGDLSYGSGTPSSPEQDCVQRGTAAFDNHVWTATGGMVILRGRRHVRMTGSPYEPSRPTPCQQARARSLARGDEGVPLRRTVADLSATIRSLASHELFLSGKNNHAGRIVFLGINPGGNSFCVCRSYR